MLCIKLQYNLCICTFSIAFRQEATGPSSVCEGSDVTLQCVIVRLNPDNTTTVLDPVWERNEMIARTLPNHNQAFNSTTGGFTDLVITNVRLEHNNTVYTCSSSDGTIASSLVLIVTGNICTCEHMC